MRVVFEDRSANGEGPWVVTVDGKVVIDDLPSDSMDVSDGELKPLWEALGVDLSFKWVE